MDGFAGHSPLNGVVSVWDALEFVEITNPAKINNLQELCAMSYVNKGCEYY